MRRAAMFLILAALMAATVLLGRAQSIQSLSPAPVSATQPPDVNGDGAVTALDALCLQRALAALPSTAGCALPLSQPDVNGDGVTDAVDVLCVLRYVANLPATPACPLPPATASP